MGENAKTRELEGDEVQERWGEVWVGRRGRGDVSDFPLSQMAEVKRKRLICYTSHIVSTICFCASLSARPVISFLPLYDLGHYPTPSEKSEEPARG